MIPTTTDDLTDEQIFDISEQFGSFEFGDAQGAKTLEFARAIIAASPVVQGEPVGVADSLHGASGFTAAVFESSKVPEGTKLYATPQTAEQQPAPDVSGLVEALEQIRAIEDELNGGDWDEIEKARNIANEALAAHRKGSET